MSYVLLDENGNPVAAGASEGEAEPLTKEELEQVRFHLDRVIMKLYTNYPFYGMLLDRCKVLVSHQVPTAAITQSCKIFTNPEFFHALKEKQRIFLMAHEVCHAAFRHHQRRGTRDPELWNQATDYVINSILIQDMGHDSFIEGGLYSSNLSPALTAEDVYEMLKNIAQDNCPDGSSGRSGIGGGRSPRGDKLAKENPGLNEDLKRDANKQYSGDMIDEVDQEMEDNAGVGRANREKTPDSREEWEKAVAQAATRAKMQGRLPAHMDMAIKDFLQQKVDWSAQLVSKISHIVCPENRRDYSWTRPSRRFLGEDIILPSIVGYKRRVATAVDTSGSMYNNWMQAVSDIEAVRKQYGIECYHMWCDAKLYPVGWLEPMTPFPEFAKGGGGTSFVPVFEHLIEERLWNDIDALVFFTDLWGTFPEEPPFETIWITFSNEDAPFGTTIRVADVDTGY